jgi:hypothetical protein
MPQQTFRQPSNSTLDRTLNDPAASDATPKLKFSWHKDGKLSKDLACFLSGKTANADGSRKKNKEPDITISIFQSLKEITLYEPNLYRVEMEDFKGLEVVLMLGAVVIRDVYFGQIKEAFNVSEAHRQQSNTLTNPGRSPTSPAMMTTRVPSYGKTPQGRPPGPANTNHPPTANRPQRPHVNIPPQKQTKQPAPPPADPRTQWEIDAESARLKQETQAEARERKKREQEEEKRTKKLLEAEQKAARRRQAEVDKETERLKKLYGKEQEQALASRPGLPPRPQAQPRPQRQSYSHPNPHLPPHQRSASAYPPQQQWHGPYLNAPGRPHPQAPFPQIMHPRPSSSMAMLGPNSRPQVKEKKSFFSFGKQKEDPGKLAKKKSSMF